MERMISMKDTGISGGADKRELEAYIKKDTSCLIYYSRRLLRATGKMNLYITGRCQEAVNNMEMIEKDLEGIKELIKNIEDELKYL